jgi:hypothetical protein
VTSTPFDPAERPEEPDPVADPGWGDPSWKDPDQERPSAPPDDPARERPDGEPGNEPPI